MLLILEHSRLLVLTAKCCESICRYFMTWIRSNLSALTQIDVVLCLDTVYAFECGD